MQSRLFKLLPCGRVSNRDFATPFRRIRGEFLLCALACCFSLSSAAHGQYTPIRHSDFQAVYDDGTAAWPSSGSPYPIELTGVVINNPLDMLDYSNTAADPQWQVCIQATASNDFGGTTLYMRKFVPWIPGQSDDATQWTTAMNALNYPLDLSGQPVTTPLQYGDVIKVDAQAPGLFYDGKYNVNNQHMNQNPNLGFSITILQRNTTPATASITLADLKKSPDDSFIFDSTRLTGDEHYQGSLVHLDGLTLADPADWGQGNMVTVKQGNLTFPLLLGLDSAISSINPWSLQSSPFSLTAILDQESPTIKVGDLWEVDNTSGYRLWMTSASELTPSSVPEPGSLVLLAAAAVAGIVYARRRSK